MPDPKQKRFEGFVAVFYPNKFYGFITQDLPGTTSSSGIYFGARDVQPDWRGSTAYAWTPGTPVSFQLVKRPSNKYNGNWVVADDVRPVFAEEPSESLETYGEISSVQTWNGRFGELLREDGDVLFFHKNSVVDRFEGRLVNLSIGDFVYHGVGKRDDGRWCAIAIELFSETEQARLQRGLPAQEPESEPEPESAFVLAPEPAVVTHRPQSECLRPENKNRSLFELILERRKKHELQTSTPIMDSAPEE